MNKIRPIQVYLSLGPPFSGRLLPFISVGIIFLFSLWAFSKDSTIYYWMTASREQILRGEIWRIFTAPLIHADMKHFMANLPGLLVLAYFLQGYFGAWVFPVGVWIGSALVHLLTLMLSPSQTYLIGASGGVYLMAGFWGVLYLAIDRRRSLLRRIVNALAVGLFFLFPSSFVPSTSYLAHSIGFIVGLLYGLAYFLQHRQRLLDYEIYPIPEAESGEQKDENLFTSEDSESQSF